MSTNSRIGIKNDDGSIRSIYCHWDGYVDQVGKLLVEHYTNVEKINELLNLGDISILAPEIGEKQDFNCPTNNNWVVAYGRDRGEDDIDAIDSSTFKDFLKIADPHYTYLFNEGYWYMVDKLDGSMELVESVLVKQPKN